MSTAKSLLNSVYFYNGKLFGLRGGEHRRLVLNNFEVGSNFVKFQENSRTSYSYPELLHPLLNRLLMMENFMPCSRQKFCDLYTLF